MRFPLLVILAAFLLAACGQSEPPAKGGRRSTRPRRSAWPGRSARPRRQRCGDQGHQSALRSNSVRRDLHGE